MKDPDLEILLAEYRSKVPSDTQTQKWKRAVRRELGVTHAPKKTIWMQLVAACLLGFMGGALVFNTTKTADPFQQIARNDSDTATIEYVHTKSN